METNETRHAEGGECAAALNGGSDDISPVQLWDTVMNKYKVAELCDQEIARMDASQKGDAIEERKRQNVLVVAAAVEALSTLHHKGTLQKLKEFVQGNE